MSNNNEIAISKGTFSGKVPPCTRIGINTSKLEVYIPDGNGQWKLFGISESDTTTTEPIEDDRVYKTVNFTTTTDCVDATLDGKRYRLYYRGTGKLIPTTEWETITGGGFRILIPLFDVTLDPDNTFFLEFY